MYAFCWSCPSATFASQHGGSVNGKLQRAYQIIILLLRHSNCAKFRTLRSAQTISSDFGMTLNWQIKTQSDNLRFQDFLEDL